MRLTDIRSEEVFNNFLTDFTLNLFHNKLTFRSSIEEITGFFNLKRIVIFSLGKAPSYKVFSSYGEFPEHTSYDFVYFDSLRKNGSSVYADTEIIFNSFASEANLLRDLEITAPFIIPLNKGLFQGVILADLGQRKDFSSVEASRLETICTILIQSSASRLLKTETKSELEQDASALLNAITETAFLTDLYGNVLAASEAASRRFEVPHDDFIGKNLFIDYSEKATDLRKSAFREAVKTGKPVSFEDVRAGKTFDNRIYPSLDSDGSVTKLAFFSVDITDKKIRNAEKLLNEKKFRLIFDAAPIGIAVLEIYGQLSRANQRFQEILGYGADEWEDRGLLKFIHPRHQNIIEAEINKLINQEISFINEEITMRGKDGKDVQANLVISNAHAGSDYPPFLIVMIEDLSERRSMREALLLIEEKFKSAADNMLDGFGIFKAVRSRSGEITDFLCDFMNDSACRLINIEKQNLIGRKMIETYPYLKDVFFEEYRNVVESRIPFVKYAMPIKLKPEDPDELMRYVNVKAYKMSDGVTVIWEDVTEQLRADKERRENQLRYKALAHNFPNGSVLLFDKNLRYILADGSDIICETGACDVVGKTIFEIYSPEICEKLLPNYNAAFEGRNAIFDISYKGKIYEVQVKPIESEGPPEYCMALFQNITDIREYEKKLRKLNDDKDKFFSIIAHDLKNPFTALLGYTEMLTDDFDQLSIEKLRMFAGSLHRSARSVYALLENLLQWSRLQTGRIDFNPARFMLKNVVFKAVDVFQINAARKNIQII
ncbi:MAG TPA: PAS domain S-box protein, partial [Ignavibacteriales bacterium]|nr:PAS domain S-box protein [Ignavibacteriales bacterium]